MSPRENEERFLISVSQKKGKKEGHEGVKWNWDLPINFFTGKKRFGSPGLGTINIFLEWDWDLGETKARQWNLYFPSPPPPPLPPVRHIKNWLDGEGSVLNQSGQ